MNKNQEGKMQCLLTDFANANGMSFTEAERLMRAVLDSVRWKRATAREHHDHVKKQIAKWPQWKRDVTRAVLNTPCPEQPDRGPDGPGARW